MASTNKTSHYDLSQYTANDKPTYLTDYNGDMLIIDGAIYDAQQTANGAESSATIADGKAVQAQNDATTALNQAGSANTKIGDLANLTTTNKTNVVSAVNEVNTIATNAVSKADIAQENIEKFNFTDFVAYSGSQMTTTGGSIQSYSSITVASNSDGSLGKVYGVIYATRTTSGSLQVKITGTNLRPTSNITINNAGLSYMDGSKQVIGESMSIATNGDITFNLYMDANVNSRHEFVPCLYFMKDFGDTPISSN